MTSRTYQHKVRGTLVSYTAGYVLSLLTTLFAFWATLHLGSHALPAIVLCALVQAVVQLKFFLHLGASSERSWLVVGGFSVLVLGILIGGTLWIMHNLLHLDMQAPSTNDLYEHGTVAPQYELK